MSTASADYLFHDMPEAKAPATKMDHFKAEIAKLTAFSQEHDGALYVNQAAVALGVSSACVSDLIERNRLAHTVVFGRKVVSPRDVLTRMESRPPAGRPRTVSGAISLGVDLVKAAVQK